MALEIFSMVDIIETMENYIEKNRPEPEIRPLLDIGYEISGQSVILHEIRPRWNNPSEIHHSAYAKTTFVKNKNCWKVFWMRASGKWESYEPKPEVKSLKAFLALVDEDKHHCFNG
ncbi:hypothetical protein AEM51_08060 [Bacteroidetes bacterium UKL13-3]|jgi:hypothetical protein|nr:hypothetical protein AEM51_08060 [Bacteroidetes bacterium UKL13-3]HCP94235.1 hypothetical protein [Bacteroidota bacterium]